ncbi:hypothetical protein AC578_10182 [Pseudocercospora eumusae]|uniref:F-box domain-containing protein n=1 Tax=Pseudocercospora eumusae TaxID=321146 RepID=A0A139HYS4_9PEZI|nr:hypothetical protein AC578_10182 [Pseudocercospora eumusae]
MGRRDAHISPAHAAWTAAKARASQQPSTRLQQQQDTSIDRNVRNRSGQTQEQHGIPLLDLPPELLPLIFDYLDKSTIYNARTTCKVLAKVGAEYILDSIHAVYKRDNLEELLEIARKPAMVKFTHTFWFQADRFGPAMTFPEWDLEREDLKPWNEYNIYHELPLDHDYETSAGRRAFDNARKRFAKRKKGKHSKAAIAEAYEQYKATIADQDSIVDERLDHQCFYELFAACSNLTDVAVSIGHGTSGYIDKGRKAYKNIMMHPYGDIDYRDQGVHQFWTVVEALHHAKRQPRRFFLGDVSYRMLRHTWRDAPVDPLVENLMQNLRELRIGFSIYDDEPLAGVHLHEVTALRTESNEFYRRGLLAKWLGSAQNLRVLKIRMWHTEFRAPYARMEDALGTTTWPKLRELGLSEFAVAEDYLVDLLLRHKDSLRRLSLSDIHLSSGALDGFVDRVGGKLPKLRKVKLRNHFRDSFNTEMEFADEGTVNGERDATEYQLLRGGDPLDSWLENDGMFPEDLDSYEPPSRLDESDAGYTTDGSEVSYGSDDFDDTI